MPSPLAHIALIGWLPVVLALFAVLPARRAIIAACVFAWLFLPMFGYKFSGFPDYTKVTATSLGVFLGGLLFAPGPLLSFRPRWFDVPMLVWCLVPFASSVSSGYGAYEGVSGVFTQVVSWGMPYLVGRAYFGEPAALKDLALGMVIGAVVYIPLCLWEIRMAPGLHKAVYGFHQHSFLQTRRLGGFRPMVFMQHGLAVGLYMSLSTLLALWCGTSGSTRDLWRVPLSWVAAGLAVTTLLCKSTGAMILLLAGVAVWAGARTMRTRLPLVVVATLPLVYMGARTVGGWRGYELVDWARELGPVQAQSLEFRINSENGVWAIVRDDLLLGKGRFSFSGERTEASNDQKIVGDGMWIIALGKYGLVGVTAWAVVLLLPAFTLIRRHEAQAWTSGALAPAAACCVLAVLYVWDSLLNAMINPLWLVAVGGALACVQARGVARPARSFVASPAAAPRRAGVLR